MKPTGKKNYGSIPHLSKSKLGEHDKYITEEQEHILTIGTRDKHDTVLVFEKYDGSNVGIAKKNGKIYALTRSGYEANTSPYKQHHLFSDWVSKRKKMFSNILQEGERIAGEWMLQAHGLRYDIMLEPIVFFDLFNANNERKSFAEWSEDFPHKSMIARLIHCGCAMKVEDLLPKLNAKTPRIKSIGEPEGMIYRVERKGKVDFLAKWVRPDFEAGKYIIGKEESELIYNI